MQSLIANQKTTVARGAESERKFGAGPVCAVSIPRRNITMQCKVGFVAVEAVIYKDGLGRKRAAVCVRLSSYRQAIIKKRHRSGV